jgi:hypothetical protein
VEDWLRSSETPGKVQHMGCAVNSASFLTIFGTKAAIGEQAANKT